MIPLPSRVLENLSSRHELTCPSIPPASPHRRGQRSNQRVAPARRWACLTEPTSHFPFQHVAAMAWRGSLSHGHEEAHLAVGLSEVDASKSAYAVKDLRDRRDPAEDPSSKIASRSHRTRRRRRRRLSDLVLRYHRELFGNTIGDAGDRATVDRRRLTFPVWRALHVVTRDRGTTIRDRRSPTHHDTLITSNSLYRRRGRRNGQRRHRCRRA